MKTAPGIYTRRNGTKCVIKVFRQSCVTFDGTMGSPIRLTPVDTETLAAHLGTTAREVRRQAADGTLLIFGRWRTGLWPDRAIVAPDQADDHTGCTLTPRTCGELHARYERSQAIARSWAISLPVNLALLLLIVALMVFGGRTP